MMYPFLKISAKNMPRIFFPLLVLTLILMVVMNWIAISLETNAAPYGIISFELAGNAANSLYIIDSWDESALLHAAFSLGLDYLFLVVYSTTIALACIWAARILEFNTWWMAVVGTPLAWGLWLAALLDGVENTGLILILFGSNAQFWAPIARWCAVIKFGIIFAGLTYAFLGLVVYLSGKVRG
jgi:hypothetical protein